MNLGIMQGRLSKPVSSKIQEFPRFSWNEEFAIANKLQLSRIEWTIDFESTFQNPLLVEEERSNILSIQSEFGVFVDSVTMDYFIEAPIHKCNEKTGKQSSWENLSRILHQISKAGIRVAVLPIVHESGVEDSRSLYSLRGILGRLDNLARRHELLVALECEMPLEAIDYLISPIKKTTNLGFNFDMGNSAAIGNDPIAEMNLYGCRLFNVHIKDRLPNGITVPLGMGAVNFEKIFEYLGANSYSGNLILQCARGPSGFEFQQTRTYLTFLREKGLKF